MNELAVQIIAGLVVAVVSGVAGYIIKSRLIPGGVLPRALHIKDTQSYSHLIGKWHLYWLSYDPSNASQPQWMQGVQEIQVKNNQVVGTTELIDHLLGNLHYKVRGEIRAGKMIATDTCVEDETEFACVIYPSLMSKKLLVGTFMGFDNLSRPIAAPAILSRDELAAGDLNRILQQSNVQLIPIADYEAHFVARKQPSQERR